VPANNNLQNLGLRRNQEKRKSWKGSSLFTSETANITSIFQNNEDQDTGNYFAIFYGCKTYGKGKDSPVL
jgi:hypothetical protein